MPKVYNPFLANLEVGISTETVKFDANGVGEIKSTELYEEVLKLANFSAYDEKAVAPKAESPKDETTKETKEEGSTEEGNTEEKSTKPATKTTKK